MKRRTPLRRSARGRTRGRASERHSTLSAAAEIVHARARGLCEARFSPKCRERGDQAHHVRLRSAGGSDDPSNLVWVCFECHTAIHAEPARARAAGLYRGRYDT